MANFLKNIFRSVTTYQKEPEGKSAGVSEAAVQNYDTMTNSIFGAVQSKKALYQEYITMAQYPEVADAIDEIVNESITLDNDNQVISLKILDSELSEKENIVLNLQKEFDYIVNNVLDFSTTAEDLFRKFYIEGELYVELKINPKEVSSGIMGVQVLPSYTMTPVYDDENNIDKYVQNLADVAVKQTPGHTGRVDTEIEFEQSQISYVNSGLMNYEENYVYSYLERAKVPYRQLKWMENAVLIYRITRAPERRVFYVDVGKLPKSKADEYLKTLIRRFKNKKVYNPSTGEVDVGTDVLSMTEDFYFPVRGSEGGSRVEPLPGGEVTPSLVDVQYFLNKLYKALKIPASRAVSGGGGIEGEFSGGEVTATEISKDEIKFAKYAEKIRNRFIDLVYQIFFTHLEFKGLLKKYNIDKNTVAIVYNEKNQWKELTELELLRGRGEILGVFSEYKGEFFSKQYILKNIMGMTDDEIIEDAKQMAIEEKEGPLEDNEDEVEGDDEDTEDEDISDTVDMPVLGNKTVIDTPVIDSSTIITNGRRK